MELDDSSGTQWWAHSKGVNGNPQPLKEHLINVMEAAVYCCPKFLVKDVEIAAALHDFGKYSEIFQRRLRGDPEATGLDHWAPGAHLVIKNGLSELAAVAIHVHHVGLGKWARLSAMKSNLFSMEERLRGRCGLKQSGDQKNFGKPFASPVLRGRCGLKPHMQ
jgi:CRISPR-associated endonuclease Cas3-HD